MKTPETIIRREIAERGALTFERFMEFALYAPGCGYYETEKDNVGRRGDFYTSVSVGNLFGELLAFQFAEWLETEIKSRKPEVKIIEAGAHDGKLAKDILGWLQSHRTDLFSQIEYFIIEPSARRQEWQRETLKEFALRVHWLSRFNNPAIQRFNGIIFSNELLDAFPVRRLGWDAKNKKWFEWGVAVENGKFVWAKIQNPESRIQNPELEAILPDNYTVEISPAAENWWREAASVLENGKLLAIDYGLTDDELFSPARTRGTLRAYSRHHLTDDILANAGGQDLTAHVNFSAIQKAGEKTGLKTEVFSTQTKFLAKILEKTLKDKSFGEWTPARTRQFQTLTHPEHLGRAFRVLVQSR
ncbi:MAG TPA: SAM-dependent methyltransferase [Verrucomicrobiae bacterium]|jgi:SAM-dependent MidA family methyltransferase|nr:SAM-dependent methyltransferase [Verrucomicrobiae bacterium]